jgi:hypothetical protein
MPITPQTIHAGKNDPRILNVGAREHPAAKRTGADDAAAAMKQRPGRPSDDRDFPVNFPVVFRGIVYGPFV